MVIMMMTMACKKDSINLFNQEESGSSIYFQAPFLATNTGKGFSFGFSPPSVKDTTFALTIASTGAATDKDRDFTLEVDPASTLIKGTNFDFLNPTFTMPAGKTTAKVNIKFYRTADIQTNGKFLFLNLIANDKFNTKVDRRITTNKDTLSLLNYVYVIDDIVSAPYAWAVTPYKTNFDNYFGAYSKIKLQLLVQLFSIDPVVFTDSKYATTNYFSVSLLSYWSGYMKLWLAKEAAAGRIYKDENGVVIAMGPRAS